MTPKPHPHPDRIKPTGKEIEQELRRLAKANPHTHKLLNLGRTQEGRPLLAMVVSDKSTPNANKQNTHIYGGRHGNEESGRAIAIATLKWLTTKQAKRTLQHQRIIVVPNFNPDGTARDCYRNADDVNVCIDYAEKNPCEETQAYLTLLDKFPPDALVDLHSRGYAGFSHDMVIHPELVHYTADHIYMADIIKAMTAAGEAKGTLHISHPANWDGWKTTGPIEYTYKTYKATTVLTESAEHNEHCPSLAKRTRVGLARVRAFLNVGNQTPDHWIYPGYPNFCVSGFPSDAIVARGQTAQARRNSRIELWQQRDKLNFINRQIPAPEKHKVTHLEYTGKSLKYGIGLQFRYNGKFDIKSITANNSKLKPSLDHGYSIRHDDISTYVTLFLRKLNTGVTTLTIELE